MYRKVIYIIKIVRINFRDTSCGLRGYTFREVHFGTRYDIGKNILSYNVPTNPASRFLIRVPNRLLLLFTAETVAITIPTNCLTHYIILTNKCNRWDN